MILGEKAVWQKIVGDLVVSGQYVAGEPAIVIFPARPRASKVVPYALCLSAAHLWVPNRENMPRIAAESIRIARAMGMDDTKFTVMRITSAIVDHLTDLIAMPPEPVSDKATHDSRRVATADWTINGEKKSIDFYDEDIPHVTEVVQCNL